MERPIDFKTIEAYLDDALTPNQRVEVERALQDDPEAQARLDFGRRLKELVRGAEQEVQTPDQVRRLLQQRLTLEADQKRQEQVEAYLDGELHGAERARFEQIAANSPETSRRVAFQRAFKEMLGQAGSQETTPDPVRDRVLGSLERVVPRRPARRARRWSRPLVAAASLFVVFAVALVVVTSRPGQAAPIVCAMCADHEHCVQMKAMTPGADPVKAALKAIGARPTLVRLPPGLSVYDVRICTFPNNRKALHILYRDQRHPGVLVSLYAIPDKPSFGLTLPQSRNGVHPIMATHDQLSVALWKHRGWLYSLVAKLPVRDVRQLADRARYPRDTSLLHSLPRGTRLALKTGR